MAASAAGRSEREQNLVSARAAYRSMCESASLAAPEARLATADRAVDEYFAPNFVAHRPPPGISPDISGTKQWNAAILKAFPDYNVTVDDQFTDGDKVVTRWTARGTHRGEFLGIAPTGRQGTLSGITISRYEGGKIVESWFEWDNLELMRQLGAYSSGGGSQTLPAGVTLNITINRA